jgi:hypothetical protein
VAFGCGNGGWSIFGEQFGAKAGEVGNVVLLEGASQGGDGRGKERGMGEGYQESGGALSNGKGLGKMGGLEGQIDKPEVIG